MKPKATLILGGGSALGLAHIGVLEILERHYEISGIIGTSMGAIIGGLYALGKSPREILEIAKQNRNARVFSPLNLDRRIKGIFDGKAALELFTRWTDSKAIETGSIPFYACAYDLLGRATIIIDRGSYAKAMRASSSLPLIFAPYEYSAHLFVDGGVEHPLPLAFAGLHRAELVIAVNVLPYVAVNARFIHADSSQKNIPKRVGRLEVVMQSVFQNQAYLAMRDIIAYAPDLLIDAALPEGKPFALHKAQEFYEYGKQQAEKTLSGYREPSFIRNMRRHYRHLISRRIGLPERDKDNS